MSDKVEFDLEDLDDLKDLIGDERKRADFSFQKVFSLLVLNWQYFLFSFIIFVSGAILYLRYTEPTYKLSARMLIKDERKQNSNASQLLTNMIDLGFVTNSSGIDNEVEVMQSRILMRDVVRELHLNAEFRIKGHVMDKIVYRKQALNVEMDPVVLDSLDKDYMEWGEKSSIRMEITRKKDGYFVEGATYQSGNEKDSRSQPFQENIDSLPASVNTALGTLTLTASQRFQMQTGETYIVTILPPMLVATNCLSAMTVEPTSKRTDIAMVTLTDKNPQRGMDFLRRLAVCYNRRANADKNEVALRTEEFINERVKKINEELGLTEDELADYKRRHSMTGLSMDAAQAVQLSNQFSARLSETDAQIRLIDYLRDYVGDPRNKYQVIPSNVGLTDGATTQLISDYNQTVLKRNRLLTVANEEAPQVQTLTATIDDMAAGISTALLQARHSADIARQGVMEQYLKYQSQVAGAPAQEQVLTQIGRHQEVQSGILLLLLQKREENSISLAATADKGRLIDEPLNEGKEKPKKTMVFLSALLLAFALPLSIIWLIGLLRYRIEGHDDVQSLTKLPIIADIPMASDNVKSSAGIVVHENKNTQMDEIFRSLRTNVKFLLKEHEKKILFSSSISGEGKTFCAANLAMSFALLGQRVVLCGLDIRKPALGRLFGIADRNLGITTLLTKEQVTLEDVQKQIVKSGVSDNLHLLLSGPIPPNPSELLARKTFQQVISLLEQQYDYVIFDTAPVGLVTDTLQIAEHADCCVLVCRADYTPKSSFGQLNQLAAEGKLPNASIAINGIDMSRRKYGYYYGYGVYGKYGRYGNYGKYGNYGHYGMYADSHYGLKDDNSIKK
ncbi:exopolysaccharide transport family protein [Prevotella sp. P6B4]|uniref:exopolysaccharide transport family protein n=1 Tax=Prevotella sp. P6B4 TaxID=1410614 RepID=UPI000A477DEB|nr:tyrosine-protein kinase family protein [Prevotella sp. P6B4]